MAGSPRSSVRFVTLAASCTVLAAAALALPATASAQPVDGAASPDPEAAPEPEAAGPIAGEPLAFRLVLAGAHRFDTELDGGTEYEVTSYAIEPELTWNQDRETQWSFGVSYIRDEYDFSGTGTGLGSLDPWGDVQLLSVSALLRRRLDDRWTFFGGPVLRFAAEEGANLDDGLSAGGFAGFGYRVDDRLTIGPGVGVFSEIEGDVDVFPVIIVNWRIRDDLVLRTGGGTGATRGPGLELGWQAADDLEVVIASRYESERFRLDDEGAAPDGVGEEEGFGLLAGVRWTPSPSVSVSLFGGVRFESRLTLEDDRGRELFQEDADPQPVAALTASIRF